MMKEVKALSLDAVPKESGSLIELLRLPRTQSLMSKLGFALERALLKFVGKVPGVKDLRTRDDVRLYGHQLDVLFRYNTVVYYFEVKANLNLDTEKSKSVKKKLHDVGKRLRTRYPSNRVVCAVLSGRYARRGDVTHLKSPLTTRDVHGYADFFDLFRTAVSPRRWEGLFRRIGAYIETQVTLCS